VALKDKVVKKWKIEVTYKTEKGQKTFSEEDYGWPHVVTGDILTSTKRRAGNDLGLSYEADWDQFEITEIKLTEVAKPAV
jgi:hypothetical protein